MQHIAVAVFVQKLQLQYVAFAVVVAVFGQKLQLQYVAIAVVIVLIQNLQHTSREIHHKSNEH